MHTENANLKLQNNEF